MWSHIIGHERPKAQLARALETGRLPNALLFSGPKGVGKRLVAEAFAAALLCPQSTEHDQAGCGTCPSCKKFRSGNHPDFFLVEPVESERGVVQSIKIDPLRELQQKLQYHPLESGRKIAVIDDADKLVEEAANSLLKILEEPPPVTHFVLITPLPHRMLPTIRSRCQHITFGPLPDEGIAAALIEKHGLSPEEALRAARLAGGSMGRASLLKGELIQTVVWRLPTLLLKANSADIMEAAETWKGIDLQSLPIVFDLLASWYRDMLRCQVLGEQDDLVHPEAAKLAGRFTPDRLLQGLAEINTARLSVETSANKQLMFEQLLFTLTGS